MTIETTEADGQESNGAEAETQAATEEKFTPTVLNEPTATETVETVKTNDEVASTATPTVSPYEDYFKSLSEEDRAKEIKQFEVFKTPSDLAKSYRELQKKFSAGEHKKPLSENPTPAELEAYRKNNNIPSDFKEYKEDFKDGFIFSEDDKPELDGFKEAMHKANAPQSVFKAAVDAYIDMKQKELSTFNMEAHRKDAECNAALKMEYGLDLERHKNHVRSVLERNLGESWELFNGAVGSDGNFLLHNPAVFKGLLKMAQEIDPVPTLTGHTDITPQTLDNRLKEIMALQISDSKTYLSAPIQTELQNIIKLKERYGNK